MSGTKADHNSRRAKTPRLARSGVSVLNGFVGDFLCRRNNPLAIEMCFVSDGIPISMTPKDLCALHPLPHRKLSISVHGLCCSERSWDIHDAQRATGHDTYGSLLQSDFGYADFYLRYNSGVSIAQNGRRLAGLLQQLVETYGPGAMTQIDEIVLLGHSMGGLVIRSACEQGLAQRQSWVVLVSRIFYLGTPHNGADLEKLVSMGERALATLPSAVAGMLGQIMNVRSGGIKDLRDGLLPDTWLASAQHYMIAGTLSENPTGSSAHAIGDALVRVPNATAEGLLPNAHRRVFAGIHHLRLAHDRSVYQQIRTWCRDD